MSPFLFLLYCHSCLTPAVSLVLSLFLGLAISSPVQDRVNSYLVTQRTFISSRRKESFSCPGEKTPFLSRRKDSFSYPGEKTSFLIQEKRLLFLSRRKDSFSCPGLMFYTFARTGLQRLGQVEVYRGRPTLTFSRWGGVYSTV